MKIKNLFWNVDTQVDFIEPTGKLYVEGAEKLKPILAEITKFAAQNNITVVNTCDFHYQNSHEISEKPNFINTFPAHCLASTYGVEFIEETRPKNPITIAWDKPISADFQSDNLFINREIVIQKDDFDVFLGNQYTNSILELLNPLQIFVYGVTTNVCVDKAVVGLVKKGYEVFVIENAIKELPQLPLPFDKWKELNVKTIHFSEIEKYLL